MRTIIAFILTSFSMGWAHDGDHGPGAIKNGKLMSTDGITYYDAGADIQWAKQRLRRKVTEKGQVIYQFVGSVNDEHSNAEETDKYLELKAPGGELLKAFSFDHAGEWPGALEVHSPDLSSLVMIPKGSDLPIRWEAHHPASMIKIIIEVRSNSGTLMGRLTVSANDDGEFDIPLSLLTQLPEGQARIAIKRIWLGGFHPLENKNEMFGVRTATSIVGQAKVVH